MISRLFLTSRAPVGSSHKMTSGDVTRLLKMATLCFSPPDKFLTFLLAKFEMPNLSNSAVAIFFALLDKTPFIFKGRITLFKAVKSSNKL